MYKAVVFDLDGTLLDTLDDLTTGVNLALTEFGLPPRSREEVRSFIGNGIANLMERAVGIQNYPSQGEVLSAFKRYYGACCAEKTKPYEGILELLQTLKERGIACAVLSNKADFATKKLAEQYFGDLLVEAVGENEALGVKKKPAPDGLLCIMQRLGIDKEDVLFVGDSEVDIQTAKNAQVDCVSVTWGFKEKEFLAEHGGKIFVDTPMEIVSVLEKQRRKEE